MCRSPYSPLFPSHAPRSKQHQDPVETVHSKWGEGNQGITGPRDVGEGDDIQGQSPCRSRTGLGKPVQSAPPALTPAGAFLLNVCFTRHPCLWSTPFLLVTGTLATNTCTCVHISGHKRRGAQNMEMDRGCPGGPKPTVDVQVLSEEGLCFQKAFTSIRTEISPGHHQNPQQKTGVPECPPSCSCTTGHLTENA